MIPPETKTEGTYGEGRRGTWEFHALRRETELECKRKQALRGAWSSEHRGRSCEAGELTLGDPAEQRAVPRYETDRGNDE